MSLWTDYTWIVVCGALASFFTAYGIGANDVANAFGSSVAARTLTLRQALLIAAVCEFSGSVLLGGQVTRTVAGGIARLSTFERVPELYMFGMLCALVASGTWLLVATYLELPVSTTHSMIGAVLGFAFVYGGVEAVVWMQPTDRFPFMSGMVPIVLSWFTSPLLCGLATAALFVVLRSAVLRRENSLQLTYVLLPILVLLTVFVNCFFVLNKGASRELTWSIGQCAWVSAAAAGGCSLITVVALVPLLRRVVGKEEEKRSRRRLQLYRAASRGVDDAAARGSAGTGGTGAPATRSSSAAQKHGSHRVSGGALDPAPTGDDFAAGGGAGGDSGTALLAPPPAAVVAANHGRDGGGNAGGDWGRQSQQHQQQHQHSGYGPPQQYDGQAGTAMQLHAVLRHSHSRSHSQVSYQHASIGTSQYGNSQYGTTMGAMDATGGIGTTTEDERFSQATQHHSSSAGGAAPAPVPYGAGRSASLPHPRYLKDSESYGPINNSAPPRGTGVLATAQSMRALANPSDAHGPGAATGSSSSASLPLGRRESADSRGLPVFPRTGSGRLVASSAAATHVFDAAGGGGGTDSGTAHASSSSAPSAAVRTGVEGLASGPGGQSEAAAEATPSGALGPGQQQCPAEGSGAATLSGEGFSSHQDGSQGGAAMADSVTAHGSVGAAVQLGGGSSGTVTPGAAEPGAVAVGGGGSAMEEQAAADGRMAQQSSAQGQGAPQAMIAVGPQVLQQQAQWVQPLQQAPSWQAEQPQQGWSQSQQGWSQPPQQLQQNWGQQQQGWQQQHGQQQGWQVQQHWQQQQQQGWQQQQQQGWQQRQQPWQPQQQQQQWHRSSAPQAQHYAANWNPQQQGWQQGQQQPAYAQQPQQQQWQQQQHYGNPGGYAGAGPAANAPGYGQRGGGGANPFARQNYAQQAGPIAEGMDWTRKSLGWANPASAYGGSGQEGHDAGYGRGDTPTDLKAAAAHDADASYDDADSEMESGGDHDRAQHSPSGVGGGGAGGGGQAVNPHWQNTFDQLKAIVLHGTRVNVHDALETDMTAQAIHLAAEVFDPDTEYAFRYLQVITAMCDSFSHGANDVANAVGPFCAIWYIYNNMRIDYQADLPIWILVVGGAGIVVGLGTYGYNIIRAIGMRLSAITPARGFCIELATAVVVVVASNYGLPISTTHCQVGATAGMGLTEGSAGINWVLALQFFLGWVVTLLITGVLSAALFAAGAYAPSIIQERDVAKYEDTLLRLTAQLDSLLNRTNQAGVSDPATWGTYSAALQAKLQSNAAFLKDVNTPGTKSNTRPVQHLDADTMTAFLNSTVTTYLNNSLPYIGGMPAKGLVLPRDRGA
ncbi:hypothetical protein CHLRE_16g676757v5 [Chlamydomonas reinhardtii]|uniref:Phosphate transporter n=1 Tax=Chlamydomonas reinhardtii TaxID=3055 RepID=A0A2K3CVU6_CHLRE|nr:uncharacterized protein CHLRE_16g676757v5 [Chlamydomonas reinhardtii]PNW72407.1 hypothetical protein CHLRE_16g676757v5 [Chlamydomonas reinhardtii]